MILLEIETMTMGSIQWVLLIILLGHCWIEGISSAVIEQLVRNCLNNNDQRRPIIIDTDADMDDLWAIHYLLNVNDII